MNSKNYMLSTIVTILAITCLYVLFSCLGHGILQKNEIEILLFSSLILLTINIFIVEKFFATPTGVVANSLNGLLLLIPLWSNTEFGDSFFIIFFIYFFICLTISVLAIILFNSDKNPDDWKVKTSNFLKSIATAIGKSKIMYSCFVLVLLSVFYRTEGAIVYSILVYLFVIMFCPVIDVLNKGIRLYNKKNSEQKKPIGNVITVKSKSVFIVDLYDNNEEDDVVKLFDIIEFQLHNQLVQGRVIDIYILDTKKQAKVLEIGSRYSKDKRNLNVVYKSSCTDENVISSLNSFVGVIVKESTISRIKFEYTPNNIAIKEGNLLLVEQDIRKQGKLHKKQQVIYQVIEARTDTQNLETNNQSGLITAEALQLGVWIKESATFEKYEWVPEINTRVFLATNIEGLKCGAGEMIIGSIEDTKFDVIIDLNDLITHHTAILGITGTGKSVFARDIIKKLAEEKHKVFCVDITGEISEKINNTINLIGIDKHVLKKEIILRCKATASAEQVKNLTTIPDLVNIISTNQGADFYGRDPVGVDELREETKTLIKNSLADFIDNKTKYIGVLELNEIYNTDATLEYTKLFFQALFELAKEGKFKDKSACIVLEEAHTITPEEGFHKSKATKIIEQIALQGRKSNLGLMVISQRTANVSKSILTQCNTMISFKQFDNTSKDFLSNNYSQDLSNKVSTLKTRTAIISGKALKSDVPLIFKVKEIPNA